jgi:hypothetical protein
MQVLKPWPPNVTAAVVHIAPYLMALPQRRQRLPFRVSVLLLLLHVVQRLVRVSGQSTHLP